MFSNAWPEFGYTGGESSAGGATGTLSPPLVQAFIVAAGADQASATPLTVALTIVTETAPGAGVRLATSQPIRVLNRGVNPLLVYPPANANGQLEEYGINVPVTIVPGGAATFISQDFVQWFTAA